MTLVNFKVIKKPDRTEARAAISGESNDKKLVAYADAGGDTYGGLFINIDGGIKEFVAAPRKRWEPGGSYGPNSVVYWPEVPHGPWWVFSTLDADTGDAPSSENPQWNGYQYLEEIIEYLLNRSHEPTE